MKVETNDIYNVLLRIEEKVDNMIKVDDKKNKGATIKKRVQEDEQ